jgi:hypothetical protein
MPFAFSIGRQQGSQQQLAVQPVLLRAASGRGASTPFLDWRAL